MSQNIVYVGIDVDDASYLGCSLNQRTGEVLDFHCRPTLKGLAGYRTRTPHRRNRQPSRATMLTSALRTKRQPCIGDVP